MVGKNLTPRQLAGRMNRKKRRGLTPEGLVLLRDAARMNRPWTHATGPRTAKGKETSRKNAWRAGSRANILLPPEVQVCLKAVRLAESGHGDPPTPAQLAEMLATLGDQSLAVFIRGTTLFHRCLRFRLQPPLGLPTEI